MTPNPKNIGAAPEEMKFRVGDRVRILPVVRDADEDSDGKRYPGTSPEMLDLIGQEITLEPTDNPKWPLFGAGWYWVPEWLEKVPDAAGVPEPQAKGPSPSEVPQPGEGVDLEAMEKAMHTPGAESWRTLLGGIPALIAEVRRLRSSQEVTEGLLTDAIREIDRLRSSNEGLVKAPSLDLEAALDEMGATIEDIIVSDCRSTRSRAQDAAGAIMELVRSLIARAAFMPWGTDHPAQAAIKASLGQDWWCLMAPQHNPRLEEGKMKKAKKKAGNPRPKTAGGRASASKFPILARVRANTKRQTVFPHMPQPGSVIRVNTTDGEIYVCDRGFLWFASSLDILLTTPKAPKAKRRGK